LPEARYLAEHTQQLHSTVHTKLQLRKEDFSTFLCV
jgi:hypothetical protein